MWRSHAGRPVLAQSQDLFVGLRKGFGCWNNLVWNSATIAFVQSPNWFQTGCKLELEDPSAFWRFHVSSTYLLSISHPLGANRSFIFPMAFDLQVTSRSNIPTINGASVSLAVFLQDNCWLRVRLWGTTSTLSWTWRRKGCNRKIWHVKDMENNGKWLKWHLADLSTQCENYEKPPCRCDQMSSKSMSAGLMGTLVSKIFDTDHGIVPTP